MLAVGNYPPSDPPATEPSASTGASATRATPGRPTPWRRSGTSPCSSSARAHDVRHCARAPRRGSPRRDLRHLASRPPPAAAPCLAQATAAPRSAVDAWTTGRTHRARAAPWTARRGEPWTRRKGSTGARSSRRSVTTPRRSGGGWTTTSDAASSVISARTGRRIATARRRRPRSRSRRWSKRGDCGCSPGGSPATSRRRRGVDGDLRGPQRPGGRLEVGKVINCTGPNTNLAEVRDPFVQSLRERGTDPAGSARARARHGRRRAADRRGRTAERASEPRRAAAERAPLGAHGGARAARRGGAARRRLCG